MEEILKDVKDYEGFYQVSNFGRVKRVTTDRILKSNMTSKGYLLVKLCKNSIKSNKRIHRLVAEAFIPNSENKPYINHIDEDKTNNHVSNLEWVTAKENSNHGTLNERISKAISRFKSIPIIATNIKTGKSTDFYGTNDCARQLGLYQSNITAALKGRYKQTGGYTFKYKEEEK